MKPVKAASLLLMISLGVLTSGSALAFHHGGAHVRFGVFVGAPVFGYYPPPYYYYPLYYPPYYLPVVAAPSSPPVYVEQGSVQPAPAQSQGQGYWYYCASSRAYYPYVKECPAGWQRVAPQPGN